MLDLHSFRSFAFFVKDMWLQKLIYLIDLRWDTTCKSNDFLKTFKKKKTFYIINILYILLNKGLLS